MLVQFSLKNVLSFKDETILDMTAINAYKEHKDNLISIGNKEKFLRVAAIYGANASGKSNLFYAMNYFQRIIAESFNNVDEGEMTAIDEYYVPFSFDNEDDNSEFEIVEIIGEYEYRYGFEYNNQMIVSEWMYRKNFQTNRTSIIIERAEQKVEFGSLIRKECDIFKEQIPAETLVLSFFNKLKLKTEIFREVYSAIMDTLVVSTDAFENIAFLDKVLPSIIDEEKDTLVEFLGAIDTGIIGIDYEKKDNTINFFTTHLGKNGEPYQLPLLSESQGTIKSIAIYIHARIAVMYNKLMFVDELNVKLHPLLLKFIVDLFYKQESRGQLIYTTHDTTLMDRRFFRRDQIWFVQKDEFGYSELVALSDFKVRTDASFEKDYLAGVYGGIPSLKSFEMKEGN